MGTGSESMDITKAELLTALKRMNDFQQDTQELADTMGYILKECSWLISLFDSGIDSTESILTEIRKMYESFIKYMFPVYRDIAALYGGSYAATRFFKETTLEILDDEPMVEVIAKSDKLVITLPVLPVNYYNRKGLLRSHLFERELAAKLDMLIGQGSVPQIKHKHIVFLQVFAADTPKLSIPDNDNYDYKGIIDIITDKLGHGDNGIDCWLTMESVRSEKLKENCYILVKSQDDYALSLEDEIMSLVT